MSIISWIIDKLRNRRFAMTATQGRALIFGCIYKMSYSNFKKDPAPLIFTLYSGFRQFVYKKGFYTDGLNLNYMSVADKQWLARTIYLLKKSNQILKPHLFYRLLKLNRPSIVRDCYRRYHTSMISAPKMVSAGFTSLNKLVYPYNDPYIQFLNQQLEPKELRFTKVKVAYSRTELADRINQTLNSKPISSLRANNTSSTGLTPSP